MLKFKNVNDAWIHLAKNVVYKGDVVGNTKELTNVSFQIENPLDNIVKSRHNFSLTYYLGETVWYGAGKDDVEFISKFGRIWNHLTDNGIYNNSAYGYILKNKHGFDQIEKAIELLRGDQYSRRAVLNINIPRRDVIETKDEMCTIALQFLIRDGKLNMTGIMRSNDLWTGTPYDIFYFTTLQRYVAYKLNIDMGTYTHFATSLHCYLRDEEKLIKSFENDANNVYADIDINGMRLLLQAEELYYTTRKEEDAKLKLVELCKKRNIIKGKEVEKTIEKLSAK